MRCGLCAAARRPLYNGKSSGIIGGLDTFRFGFHDRHPQKPFGLYHDDLVLGTTRVGCLKLQSRRCHFDGTMFTPQLVAAWHVRRSRPARRL